MLRIFEAYQVEHASIHDCEDRSREIFTSRVIIFLYLAVKHSVVPYMRAKAEWGGIAQLSYPKGFETRFPLLLGVLSPTVPEPTMVECLLDFMADPNFKIAKVDSETSLDKSFGEGHVIVYHTGKPRQFCRVF